MYKGIRKAEDSITHQCNPPSHIPITSIYPTTIANRVPAIAIPNVVAPPMCDAAPAGLSAAGASGIGEGPSVLGEGGEAIGGTTGAPAGDPEGIGRELGAGVGALVAGDGVGALVSGAGACADGAGDGASVAGEGDAEVGDGDGALIGDRDGAGGNATGEGAGVAGVGGIGFGESCAGAGVGAGACAIHNAIKAKITTNRTPENPIVFFVNKLKKRKEKSSQERVSIEKGSGSQTTAL